MVYEEPWIPLDILFVACDYTRWCILRRSAIFRICGYYRAYSLFYGRSFWSGNPSGLHLRFEYSIIYNLFTNFFTDHHLVLNLA